MTCFLFDPRDGFALHRDEMGADLFGNQDARWEALATLGATAGDNPLGGERCSVATFSIVPVTTVRYEVWRHPFVSVAVFICCFDTAEEASEFIAYRSMLEVSGSNTERNILDTPWKR